MRKIANVNIKGGVGKSATTTTVGHMAATLYNEKTLLIDLDPQGNTTSQFKGEDYLEDFKKQLNGEIEIIENSLGDLLLYKDKDIHDCIRSTKYDNLDIICADMRLVSIEETMRANVTSPQQFKLQRHLAKIEDEYDYCFMDCSSIENLINTNALMCADEVYIPTRTDGNSIEGVLKALKMIDEIQDYNPKLNIGGCFFTCYDSKKSISRDLLRLLEDSDVYLIPIQIGITTYLERNSTERKPLLELDKAMRSRATKDYIKLTEYILAPNKKVFLKNLKREDN